MYTTYTYDEKTVALVLYISYVNYDWINGYVLQFVTAALVLSHMLTIPKYDNKSLNNLILITRHISPKG